ncbi:unnamed protein product [Rodentolepis nana]|uniref:Uncharacterized protein n=1 Tax=Rodentolepis nana TaxID=102285 RepID=A0A0R3T102_RODNA|nr:unnamed protein product [Rodentolepis nana]
MREEAAAARLTSRAPDSIALALSQPPPVLSRLPTTSTKEEEEGALGHAHTHTVELH